MGEIRLSGREVGVIMIPKEKNLLFSGEKRGGRGEKQPGTPFGTFDEKQEKNDMEKVKKWVKKEGEK